MNTYRPVHKESTIAMLPSLDLWSVPPTQISIDKNLPVEARPIAPISANTPITFEYYIGQNEYLNMSEMLLFVRLNVEAKKNAGGDMEAKDWENVIPENYLLHTLFKSVEVYMGNHQVFSCQDYHIRSYLEGLLAYSDAAKKSYLSAAGWMEKESERAAYYAPTDIATDSVNGRERELCGKLHVDLAHQGRALIGAQSLRVVLHPAADPRQYLTVNGAYTAKINFIDARLIPDISVVSTRLLVAHQKALAVAKARYPIAKRKIIRKVLSCQRKCSSSWLILTLTMVPRERAHCVLITSSAATWHSMPTACSTLKTGITLIL